MDIANYGTLGRSWCLANSLLLFTVLRLLQYHRANMVLHPVVLHAELSVSFVAVRNSLHCIMLFVLSSWLTRLDGTNVYAARLSTVLPPHRRCSCAATSRGRAMVNKKMVTFDPFLLLNLPSHKPIQIYHEFLTLVSLDSTYFHHIYLNRSI